MKRGRGEGGGGGGARGAINNGGGGTGGGAGNQLWLVIKASQHLGRFPGIISL